MFVITRASSAHSLCRTLYPRSASSAAAPLRLLGRRPRSSPFFPSRFPQVGLGGWVVDNMFATVVRWMAKKPKPKMKPIEPRTPPEQTQTITRAIFDIVKEHGPLTIADTWDHLKVVLASPLSPLPVHTKIFLLPLRTIW
ncbi:hypothetical protein MUK42_36040 [Musa troglodytarum]|uniref:Uncharacterized protein n=1 Tax=Musa troglodytarum TaxID=320322 RepID=A0A9E7L234_9LILI|nr:hypothetical protein MUK42_36040 [Musa troglodytarum]